MPEPNKFCLTCEMRPTCTRQCPALKAYLASSCRAMSSVRFARAQSSVITAYRHCPRIFTVGGLHDLERLEERGLVAHVTTDIERE